MVGVSDFRFQMTIRAILEPLQDLSVVALLRVRLLDHGRVLR
jgi:hypothetical protein